MSGGLHAGSDVRVEVVTNPEVKKADSGLLCYRDKDRFCGADCMAYLTEPPPEADYKGQSWAHCHLLVAEFRGAKHLTILAGEARRLSTPPVRVPSPPPPNPLGK